MNIENANELVKNILLYNSVSDEELSSLNEYINYLIDKMNDNTISYGEQALLDVYTNYLRNNIINSDIVDKYDDVINKKNNIVNEEHVAQREGHTKIMKMENKHHVNNNGIILTTVILEVSLLLGLTIAILILALS